MISDDQALRAVTTLFKHLKIVVEPGGAVAVARINRAVPSRWTLLLRSHLVAI